MTDLILKVHKTADELPERSGHYLCASMKIYGEGRPYWMYMPYSADHKRFNTIDDMTTQRAQEVEILTHYWMELPEKIDGWEGGRDGE